MTPDASFCPFCNAPLVTDLKDLPEKLPCPRCGEAVPSQRWQIAPAAVGGETAHIPANLKLAKKSTFRWVVLIWVVMGTTALSYALYTKDFRRKNDPVPRKISPSIAIASPMDWPALAFMPATSTMLAGLHFEKLRQEPGSRELLQKPVPDLIQPGLDLLKKWTRLKLDDLDHVVAGISADEKGILVHAAIRTKYPYEPKEISQALVTSKSRLERLRSYFQFATAPLGEAGVWCLEEQTLVVLWHSDALTPEHLRNFPEEMGKPKLNASVQKLLEERVPKPSMAWSVGQLDEKTRGWLQPLLMFQPRLAPLAKLSEHAAGGYAEEGLAGIAYLHAVDAKATQEWADALKAWQPSQVKSYKVEAPPAEVKDREAQWITIQIRTDQARLREMIGAPRK